MRACLLCTPAGGVGGGHACSVAKDAVQQPRARTTKHAARRLRAIVSCVQPHTDHARVVEADFRPQEALAGHQLAAGCAHVAACGLVERYARRTAVGAAAAGDLAGVLHVAPLRVAVVRHQHGTQRFLRSSGGMRSQQREV